MIILEENVDTLLKMEINPKEIIEAAKKLPKKNRDAFIEDLLASTSPEYLISIQESRTDYKAGRVADHQKVFATDV